jgi:heptose III glucuronosyltransferase
MNLNLSIIIPAYNVQDWIGECLESIKHLKRDDFEVIVVNDGSSDRTLDVASNYANDFKFFQLLNQENQGLSISRNNGLKLAKGIYALFIDSDDFVDPKELCLFLDSTLKSGVDVSIGNGRNLVEKTIKGTMKKAQSILSVGIVDGPKFYLKSNQADEFNISACVRLYKINFLKKCDLFFFPSIIHEDEEFAPKVFSLARSVLYVDRYFYVRRYRIGSITKNVRHKYYNQKSIPSFIIIIENLVSFLASKNFNSEQRMVIIHAIHKCYLEIMRRELYFIRKSIKEFPISFERKEKLRLLLIGLDFTLIQKLAIWKFRFKIFFSHFKA